MEITFCVFLSITAVSVFGQPQELNGVVGRPVAFPAAVKKSGSLVYEGETVGDITSSRFSTVNNVKFTGRLQWDSNTGHFSLSELKMEDKGKYTVQNTDQGINTDFQLNVYIPVSKPNVSVISDEYPCKLMCTVERGTDATLTWYREGEHTPYDAHPPRSAPDLYLSVPVERSGIYTCEANNSVITERSDPLTVGDHCTGNNTVVIVASVLGVALLIALIALIAIAVIYIKQSFR
ncbi:Fc receptor-like protein 5 [Conger conger]|uniref:Fc receptor-like protein 5 n=1 Tax=Conger conger TaxID=82655 RepID=UPI002A5AAB66|nr:Fc receptor-like protein 5 [Conger conger]